MRTEYFLSHGIKSQSTISVVTKHDISYEYERTKSRVDCSLVHS